MLTAVLDNTPGNSKARPTEVRKGAINTMPKLNLSFDKHILHGQALYKAREILLPEHTFFVNSLGENHPVTLAIERSLKALDKARNIADNLLFRDCSEYEGPSPYYSGWSKPLKEDDGSESG